MNAFLVIAGSLIIGLLIALWVVKHFQIKTKLWGIPLQYLLDIVLVAVAVITAVIIKVALGNKSKALEVLLAKLKISQAVNSINIINDHLTENQNNINDIDSQIKALQGNTANTDQITSLTSQKDAIQKQIDDLNSQKQGHTDNKSSLEDRVKQMSEVLNG
jgi:septal ring factor EnvC (AmiA/AmiB activator)